MSKIAIFPGSFDPITLGHQDIIERASKLFDQVVISIGENSQKKYLFDIDQRIKWIEQIFKDDKNVSVKCYSGLTVDYCKAIGAKYIVRGVRTTADFDYEKNIAQLNQKMSPDIETILITSKPEYSHISSTIVREIIINKGNTSSFLPQELRLN